MARVQKTPGNGWGSQNPW